MMSNSVDIEYFNDDQKKLRQPTPMSRSEDSEEGCASSCLGTFMLILSVLIIICTFPLSLIFCIRIVQEYERAVIFRLGRLRKAGVVGPGMFFIVPCLDQVS